MSNQPAADLGGEFGHLKRTLGPVMLWGLGVGYVISGEYFGWNLGLPLGGTYGMLIATLLVTAVKGLRRSWIINCENSSRARSSL